MKTTAGVALATLTAVSACGVGSQGQKPNVVFIFADDLGYGEVGVYGQKMIETPNMDSLATRGMIFTQAYTASPVSASSRCMLLTGLHGGHAYIRGNDEWAERGDVWDYAEVSLNVDLEGQRPLPDSSVTIPELLKTAGYVTGCFGKWGLGSPVSEGAPHKQGFDLFFGFNCQRLAHSYFPGHLWRNGQRVALDNEIIPPGTKLSPEDDIYNPASYQRFFQNDYSARLILDEGLNFIEDNAKNPFFVYFSPTLPHKPIQAPQRLVDKYVAKFGDEEPYTGGSYYPCRYPRATYAAMITYLDEQVGEIVAKLRETGVYDNTLIILTSDNGPGYQSEHFQSAAPFLSSAGRTKGSLYEGGIREPFIASWPGKIAPGRVSDLQVAMYDIMPTLCEVAGVNTLYTTDGISLVPEMTGCGTQPRHNYLYWEFAQNGGMQAVRIGDWKGIRTGMNRDGNMRITLYDLSSDIRETTDVSAQHSDIVARMDSIMIHARITPALPIFYLDPYDRGFRFTFDSPASLSEFLRYGSGFPPYIHAHRGGGYAGYPENCIETFRHTLTRVPAFIEIDPRVTRDSVIVLMHDPTLYRTTDASELLHDFTFEQLQQNVRLKDRTGQVTPYRVPTLRETLRWVRGKTVLIIDSKDAPLEMVLEQIREENAQANVIMMAYSPDDAKRIHNFDPCLMMQVFVKDSASYAALVELGIEASNMVSFIGHSIPEDVENILDFLHSKNIKAIVGSSRNIDKSSAPSEGYRLLTETGVDIIEADSVFHAGKHTLELWQKDDPIVQKYVDSTASF